ncbi:insulinase family protein [Pelomonas sp. V22]|uniref:M16 family metallopeptidase n=1 Tax=Pelomonas sp. V22 TaxID=2822139 RepID=UPI0024A9B92D|nr:M16 family metallopeptidase [Pelomonas sp. V22]MDI4635355.1 insulinase family protein [Pelomonas sp. V22]
MTQPLHRLLAAACLLLAAAHAATHAAALPEGLTEQRQLGGIREYRLANGLQVLLMPQPAQSQTQVTVIYKVGSRHEGKGEAGMAHLLEHVTFRGTSSVADLGDEFRRLSARYNGTTSLDRTNYFSSFAPNPATLAQILRLEATRMQQSRLEAVDFEKEKPIVLNEMGLRGTAVNSLLYHGLMAGAFRQHPYGRPVIGFRQDLEQLSLPTLRSFYARHYRPDNAVLMIAGAFDEQAALAAVAEQFGPVRAPAEALATPVASEPAQQGPRIVTLQTPSSALALAYRVPSAAQTPALWVLQAWLSGLSASHGRSLERPHQTVPLTGLQLTREPFVIGLSLQLPDSSSSDAAGREALEKLESRWISRLEDGGRDKPPAELLQLIKSQLVQQLRQRLQEPASASALLSDAVGAGDWRLPFKLIETLPQVTAEQVRELGRSYLRAENRTQVHGFSDAALGSEPQVVETSVSGLAGLFSKPVQLPSAQPDPTQGLDQLKVESPPPPPPAPMAAAASATPLPAFDPDPRALERQVRRYQLPSGLLLATLPKPAPDDALFLQLTLRWGSAADMAKFQGWRLLDELLDEGSMLMSAAEIRQLKLELQASVQVIGGPQGLTVQVKTNKRRLAAVLSLLSDQLRQPLLPEAAFLRLRDNRLARLAAAAREPAAAAHEQLRQHQNREWSLQPGDPQYQPSNEELAALYRTIKLADLRDFQRRFWSANQVQVAVVGSWPEQLFELLERYFGGWKLADAPAFERQVLPHRPLAGARFVASGGGKGSALVSLQQELPLNRADPAYPAFVLGARILANGGGSRLGNKLRQQDAISYNVGLQMAVPETGDRARLNIQATGAPAAAARIEATMHEELEKLLAEGVTAAELDQARRQLMGERRQGRSNEAPLSGMLLGQLDRGSSFLSTQLRDDEALAAVTPAQVQQALQALLKPANWVWVITGAP